MQRLPEWGGLPGESSGPRSAEEQGGRLSHLFYGRLGNHGGDEWLGRLRCRRLRWLGYGRWRGFGGFCLGSGLVRWIGRLLGAKQKISTGKENKDVKSSHVQFDPPCAANLSCSSLLRGFFLAGLGAAFATVGFGCVFVGAFGLGGGLSKRIWPPWPTVWVMSSPEKGIFTKQNRFLVKPALDLSSVAMGKLI